MIFFFVLRPDQDIYKNAMKYSLHIHIFSKSGWNGYWGQRNTINISLSCPDTTKRVPPINPAQLCKFP